MGEVTQGKIGEKGRLVIAADIREALGLKIGDPVVLDVVDEQLRISTFANRLKRPRELMQKYALPGRSMVDELIAGRRREAQQEEDEEQEWKQTQAAAKLSRP